MTMEEELTSHIGIIFIVIIVLVVFLVILNHLTEGGLVRLLVCGLLFWVPFGASVAQHCRAIPV